MGCMASCGKCIIIFLNIIFLIIGLAFTAVGVILRFFPGSLLSFMLAGLQQVTNDEFETADGTNSLTDIPLLSTVGTALLVIGVILVAVAIIAFCGTCCKYRVMLMVYIIMLVILVITLSVVGALFVTKDSSLHQTLRGELVTKVNNEYNGPKGTDGFTLATNILSYTMECCGMSGTDDFDTPHNAAWKSYRYNGQTHNIDVTPACCKKDVLKNDNTLECAKKHSGSYDPSKTNLQGCYDKIQDMLQAVRVYAIAAVVVVVVLLALLAVFGIVLFIDMGNNKVGQA